MRQEEKRIYDFRKGDVITRIKPIIGEAGTIAERDYSLVGKKITFLGIANASVYLSKAADFLVTLFLGKDEFTIQLPIELCEDGWAYYTEPDFLDSQDLPPLDNEKNLKDEIRKAVEDDNFERAEMLKKKLEDLQNSKKGNKEM